MAKPKTSEKKSKKLIHSPDLVVRGARVHNLRNIDLTIPRNSLAVLTGLSGSGKSSLAFDTIYAEGQRRYVESLSPYARQFLGLMEKPDVDAIEGLSPAIAIDQKTTGHNPRSTVGTVTEVADYLRLLWARAGVPHCPKCGRAVQRQSPSELAAYVLSRPEEAKLEIRAPVVRGRKGTFKDTAEAWIKAGFLRAVVDGEMVRLEEFPELDKKKNHTISLIIDRVIVKESDRQRLQDSLETAVRHGQGLVELAWEGKKAEIWSTSQVCPDCGISMPELEPRMFSFNSPFGACAECEGLGVTWAVSPELVIGDPGLSMMTGVILPWGVPKSGPPMNRVRQLAQALGIQAHTPWQAMHPLQQKVILEGSAALEGVDLKEAGVPIRLSYWSGVLADVERMYNSGTESVREAMRQYFVDVPCAECGGTRLQSMSRSVTVQGQPMHVVNDLAIKDALAWVNGLTVKPEDPAGIDPKIAGPIIKEVSARLRFLVEVGLDYLTLSRSAETLSGGEMQRIRLASQIGSHLTGVLYVLDEPSIGLHARDNDRLIQTLKGLRDAGNTVIVVEHDEDTIRAADFVADMGPGAGKHGGDIVAQGKVADLIKSKKSLTGQYLRGEKRIEIPGWRKPVDPTRILKVTGASENNLKDLTVEFPLGTFTAITGVSGSGKSTLINDILYKATARSMHRARVVPGKFKAITGVEHLDKVIEIDQSPIGRTPRSNPATYTGLFTPIRDLFAAMPRSKEMGWGPGRFSFNVQGGRCEACSGDGVVQIEMHFLPDVYVPCDVCQGKRYTAETLEIKYNGLSIADILELPVSEALKVFEHHGAVRGRLQTLCDVGLGYIQLGQSATTLSGGEAQRVKLATELARRDTGSTLYILDEPTTGLHMEDVRILLHVLHRLVERGNTVLVIEHNLDVVKTADWIIDLGPEGGAAGGELVGVGTPEDLVKIKRSLTGQYLIPVLARSNQPSSIVPAKKMVKKSKS